MLLLVCMMCGGSLTIACLPVHATIGSLAPALLLFARLLQGLSVGGEYGASATYVSEVATPLRRGFFRSFHYVTLIAGQLLAVLTVGMLQQLLSPEQLRGWRIPFFMGAAAAAALVVLSASIPARDCKCRQPRQRQRRQAVRPDAAQGCILHCAGFHCRRLAVFLHLYHVYAEVSG